MLKAILSNLVSKYPDKYTLLDTMDSKYSSLHSAGKTSNSEYVLLALHYLRTYLRTLNNQLNAAVILKFAMCEHLYSTYAAASDIAVVHRPF